MRLRIEFSSLALVGCLILAEAIVFAQPPAPNAAASGSGPAELVPAKPGDDVKVRRETPHLIDPEKYNAPLYLVPYSTVELSAPQEGVIQQVQGKTGANSSSQTEIVRFDTGMLDLEVRHAEAALKVAKAELAAADSDANKARVEVAEISVEMAQMRRGRASVRIPFDGEIGRVHVVPGQYVRTGQPLITVSDRSKMKVEIPAERTQVEVGKPYKVRIEAEEVEGQIEAIVPLAEQFAPLRNLFESVVSVVIVFENSSKKWTTGQSVYVPIIPKYPVAEVPVSSLGNMEKGERKVQVVRAGTVRDVPVKVMGSVGPDRVYVSGGLVAGDEVIFETSHLLTDGFRVAPIGQAPGDRPPLPGERPKGPAF